MKKYRKLIRCMAYKKGNLYIAICLDLSLAAQGDTMDEAIEKLDGQIKDFIAEVNAEPQHASQLLNRPAPLSLWVKYYWFKFLSAKNGNKKGVSFFEEDCYA
ncbi:hypothetical protein B0186_03990 [Canicola haemoglobinophilus]|uniref:DUF1902 domain-containing protein n=2 Tax=Canicola haemoglobinophilus TaxID=733 RepID=A0A1V4B227_9PAST|nr:hypothetical protein [Canicola haemoglobinophilus]OOS01247.1 hypothetical protein B0186_03990 [Canicola haemoglobinophilus]STO54439.1 Uncharacterised protein [Canicola haemoglobinophilus]STO60087.1 Uncharacterised protein [Canicola haemoglobinophilus]STO68973.1 Uncharacterised protein [Canicola haemoglobinophilus]